MGRGKGGGKSKYQEPDFSDRNPDAVYPVEAIIAYLTQDGGEGFALAKVTFFLLTPSDQNSFRMMSLKTLRQFT